MLAVHSVQTGTNCTVYILSIFVRCLDNFTFVTVFPQSMLFGLNIQSRGEIGSGRAPNRVALQRLEEEGDLGGYKGTGLREILQYIIFDIVFCNGNLF